MTIHLVTFSDVSMVQSALLCELSAKAHGVDSTDIWNPHRLTKAGLYRDVIEEGVKSARRGCNFWSWKPFIIGQAMNGLSEGDLCIYADAGVEFIDNVSHIIDRMDQNIFLFGNMYQHAHWCKRDIVEEVFVSWKPWMPQITWKMFAEQAQASVIFFRVNDKTRAFVKEWLDWCLFENGRLIDDSPSRTPNHPEFKENRHDQAILTTMAYRDGYKLHWWPAQYNDGQFIYPRGDYPDEGYPVLFHHHRKRNHEWSNAA